METFLEEVLVVSGSTLMEGPKAMLDKQRLLDAKLHKSIVRPSVILLVYVDLRYPIPGL